jgi:hypothetical protein
MSLLFIIITHVSMITQAYAVLTFIFLLKNDLKINFKELLIRKINELQQIKWRFLSQ